MPTRDVSKDHAKSLDQDNLPVACISTKQASLGSRQARAYARLMASSYAEATRAFAGATEPVELIPVPRI